MGDEAARRRRQRASRSRSTPAGCPSPQYTLWEQGAEAAIHLRLQDDASQARQHRRRAERPLLPRPHGEALLPGLSLSLRRRIASRRRRRTSGRSRPRSGKLEIQEKRGKGFRTIDRIGVNGGQARADEDQAGQGDDPRRGRRGRDRALQSQVAARMGRPGKRNQDGSRRAPRRRSRSFAVPAAAAAGTFLKGTAEESFTSHRRVGAGVLARPGRRRGLEHRPHQRLLARDHRTASPRRRRIRRIPPTPSRRSIAA